MPKPGKSGRSYHEQQDFRLTEKKVSFKNNKQSKYRKEWTPSIRAINSHLEEEDVDMRFNNDRGKSKHRKIRGGSPVPNRHQGRRKLIAGPIGWYRIYLPYGNKYDKNFILKCLLDKVAPSPFIPIMWSSNGTAVTFYLDDFNTAEKLSNSDREIPLPDGFKLVIKVGIGSPTTEVNAEMKDKMKHVMAKRYNQQTKALDMSVFHQDPDLVDIFCALFKPVIILAAIDIISENIPELEALNLNNNKLYLLTHLRRLNAKLPKLKILHIGSNRIRDITQLDSLVGLPIVELYLDGNPLCNKFKDQTVYISEVRKRFPKVIKLDGIDLPPPISFDIEEKKLPLSKQTYLCNPDGQGIVRQFLEQYFQIMDCENRQPLLQAYHEQAMFSMTMSYAYGQTQNNSPWLNWYNTDNRNLIRVTHHERRLKLLKQGHLQVVAFLQEMPQTKHDIHSFTVDLNIYTPQMLLVAVSGMFKEINSGQKTPPIRHFFRTFVIIPSGSGFCIVNEQLYITNATTAQIKIAFKTPIPAPIVQPAVPATATTSSVPDDITKQQMVQALSQETGMNFEWSRKCLEETNWDYQRAGFVFNEAKAKGAVPPEAFLK